MRARETLAKDGRLSLAEPNAALAYSRLPARFTDPIGRPRLQPSLMGSLATAMSRQVYVWGGVTLVVGLFVAVVGIRFARPPPQRPTAVPQAKDPSCHNPFRNTTRSVVSPKEDIDLAVEEEQWPELTNLLKEFARRHDWSFRDTTVMIPGDVTTIDVSVCAESSLRILVQENHWKTTHAHDHPGTFVHTGNSLRRRLARPVATDSPRVGP